MRSATCSDDGASSVSTICAVGEEHDGVGEGRGVRVVGDHDHGLAEVVDRLAQQRQDVPAGSGVESARRLIGEDDRRPRDQGAGDRDALLLAARELSQACA